MANPVNVRRAQRVYRAPYVYFCQTVERSRVVRIGHTTRPAYEQQRLQARYRQPITWLANVRAFAVLAPILWSRFAYCSVGNQWFFPDRRVMRLVSIVSSMNADKLLAVDDVRRIFSVVFPENPYTGIAQYRLSETYIRHSRITTPLQL